MDSEPLLVVAFLTALHDRRAAFVDYELKAAAVMARVGGFIEREIELDSEVADSFRVVHVIRFPSREAFAAYRRDPELTALAEERAFAISKTEVLTGREFAV